MIFKEAEVTSDHQLTTKLIFNGTADLIG